MRWSAMGALVIFAAAAALWTWPLVLEPSVGLPWWVPLPVLAVCACLGTSLAERKWVRFVVTSAAATAVGTVAVFLIWPLEDGIAQSYAGLAVLAATMGAALVSLMGALLGCTLPPWSKKGRGAAWIALGVCAAFSPLVLALRPNLVAQRVARDDRLAAERFGALKLAVERTYAEAGGPARLCDGQTVKKHYAGPSFTDRDWLNVAGNYVTEDGYTFGMVIDCAQPAHYVLDAHPARRQGDGTLSFCSDETGTTGCKAEWHVPRYECGRCAD